MLLKLKRFEKLALFLLLLICAAGAFYYGVTFQNVNDGFWHIKVGEYIVKHKVIPYKDIFSWYGIRNNLSWTSQEWLFGIIAYLVYSINGFFGVSIFVGIVNLITVLLVFFYSYVRCKNKWISLMISFFYCINSSIIVTYRPILISIPLLLIICILLEKEQYVVALIIMIVGINIHGGIYPIYIFIFGYYTILKKNQFFILSLLAVLINPYTIGIYEYTYKLMFNNGNANNYINEWHTTAIYDYKYCLMIAIFCVFIYMCAKVKRRDLIFSGALIFLSLTAVRQIVFLYTFVLPILSPYILKAANNFSATYLSDIKIYRLICKKIKFKSNILFNTILSLFIIVFSITVISSDASGFYKNGGTLFEVTNSGYPVEAVNYILKHPGIKNSNLLSDYNDSPYLIFRGVPTFVDSRQDLFTRNFNKTNAYFDYMSVFVDLQPATTLLKEYRVDYILLNENSAIYKVLRNDPILSVTYQDADYCIMKVNKNMLDN